jgi:hypothetical protein
LVLGALLGGGARGEEGTGIAWEADLDAGLARAAAEGRPVFLAVNALENEAANQALATTLYPSAAWGEATRPYVCLVGNPNLHGSGASCSRYGGIPCATHQQTLAWILRRFAPQGDLISPQHLILDADGRLAFRKEYYTRVVGPELLEAWFLRLSPQLALERAAALRVARIDTLDATPLAKRGDAARAWLRSADPLAAPGVLVACDFAADEAQRVVLIRAFDAVSPAARSIPALAATEACLAPDDRPAVTEAWIDTWLALDREVGVRLLARAVARSSKQSFRDRMLVRWFGRAIGEGEPPPPSLPPSEAQLAAEVFALLGRPDGVADPTALPDRARVRLERARRQTRAAAGSRVELAAALEAGLPPGALRRALLDASPEQVRTAAGPVAAVLEAEPGRLGRLAIAAALALLGAGDAGQGRVLPCILEAVFDPVEGPEARAEALRRLGQDPGENPAEWEAALGRALRGDAR